MNSSSHPSGPKTGKTVLVVEDEADVRELLVYNLRAEGFQVLEAKTGRECLSVLQRSHPDLILLDLMLPDISGLEVCRQLRVLRSRDCPVIVVSAKTEEMDRVVAFELGVDDYVTKPFSLREVMLRVKAVLGRLGVAAEREDDRAILRHGSVVIDPARHQVLVEGTLCDLTAKEFGLLYQLASKPGKVHLRENLLAAVWGDDVVVTLRTIDTHIRRLRQKLGRARNMIETVKGVGYRFIDTVEREEGAGSAPLSMIESLGV